MASLVIILIKGCLGGLQTDARFSRGCVTPTILLKLATVRLETVNGFSKLK
jgi:hypothetical protein